MKKLLASVFVLGLLGLAGRLHAQGLAHAGHEGDPQGGGTSARARGTFVGTIVAPDDARLPGVAVTIRHRASQAAFVTVTAGHGRYSRSNLPPGDYEISAELYGFATQSTVAALEAGEVRTVNFTLPLSTVSETVEVVGTLRRESLESSEIRDTPARDVGEALGRLPGVHTVRKGGIAADVVMHGFQSRNLTVLIDGQRIHGACPNAMDPVVFHADFAEVDHLDAGKGPFDIRHANSLGGVINVVTRAPGQGMHGNANLAFGSNGYVNPSLTASAGTARFSVLGGYSYRLSDAYRDGSGTLFTEYANFRPEDAGGRSFTAHTGWARAFLALRPGHAVQVAYTRQNATGVKYAYLQMDGIWDIADRASASYNVAGDGPVFRGLLARAYFTEVDHWMTDEYRVSSIGAARAYSMGSQADTRTAGGSVEVVLGAVTAGAEAYRRSWNVETRLAPAKYVPQYAVPGVDSDHAGVFVQYERALGPRTSLEAGGRVDASRTRADAAKANTDLYFAYKGTRSTSSDDTTASGKIHLAHALTPSLEINGGVGHTERVPDPQERYFGLKRMGGDWVGNPLLEPTGNTGLNAGLTYQHRRLVLTGSLFSSRLSNFVAVHLQPRLNAVPGIGNLRARSYESVDARLTSGELTLTAPLTDSLFTTMKASYTRGTKEADPARGITSTNMAEIHPVSGSVAVRYDRAIFFGEIEARFSGRHNAIDTDLQEEGLPSYGIVNLRIGGERRRLRVSLAVDNLFDTLYVDHLSYQRDPFRTGARVREPGRNAHVNVAYKW